MKTVMYISLFFIVSGVSVYAERWNYQKHNSREKMIFTGIAETDYVPVDTSNQNSKATMLAINRDKSKEIGKVVVVQAAKGSASHKTTVALTR